VPYQMQSNCKVEILRGRPERVVDRVAEALAVVLNFSGRGAIGRLAAGLRDPVSHQAE